jgi:serine/threonine-protein kinase
MVGTIVGTYRLEELLGDGGLGGVYRAVDSASGREAAFRVFSRDVSSDAILADRLRAMAPALKKLQHPNIASFFELVSLGADLALFLEFVPGVTLDRVRQPAGRLDTSVAVSCAVQVLRALESAHGAGVLHHALRPSNVMVTRQGTVKVLDFGIGHAFGANRKTREDRLFTVLSYLAPEQIQNQPGDARADFYSVGVLLYELLTGSLPFAHKTEFALRQAHLSEPPAPPRAIVPGLPEWLDQAVLRALAKHPASRYQNATEFRAVLEAALGLSTSREAAIVRQRDGAHVETFAAAPPIPAPPPKADAEETMLAAPPVGGGLAEAAAAPPRAAPAPPVAAGRPARGPAVLVASVLAVLSVAAAGAYFWVRGSAEPAPAVETAAPGDTPAVEARSAALAGAPVVDAPPAPRTAAAPPQSPPVRAAEEARPPGAAGRPAARAPAPAAAPPDEKAAPPPAAPEAANVEKAPDVSYRKVKLVTQAGSSEKSADVVLMLSDDRLSVTPAGGGLAVRTLRYAEITAASYSKAQKRRLGFIRSSQHLLELETADEPLLLRLDKDNFEPILAAIEARTGQAVSR